MAVARPVVRSTAHQTCGQGRPLTPRHVNPAESASRPHGHSQGTGWRQVHDGPAPGGVLAVHGGRSGGGLAAMSPDHRCEGLPRQGSKPDWSASPHGMRRCCGFRRQLVSRTRSAVVSHGRAALSAWQSQDSATPIRRSEWSPVRRGRIFARSNSMQRNAIRGLLRLPHARLLWQSLANRTTFAHPRHADVATPCGLGTQ